MVQGYQGANGFHLVPQAAQGIANQAVAGVYVGGLGECVERTVHKAFQRERQFLGAGIVHLLECSPEIPQQGRQIPALGLQEVLVNGPDCSIYEGFCLRVQTVPLADLFAERGDELGLIGQRVPLAQVQL